MTEVISHSTSLSSGKQQPITNQNHISSPSQNQSQLNQVEKIKPMNEQTGNKTSQKHSKRQNQAISQSSLNKQNKSIVGNFKIDYDFLLGQGSFSKVYKGHDLQNNQFQVAVKVIQKSILNPDLQKLVDSEIKILRLINHQSIVKCYEIVEDEKKIFIIMELCNQGDIQTIIQEEGALEQSLALPIIKEVFKGLAYLSDLNIIHRDLKVANVFLHNDRPKIADFGFALYNKSKKQFQDISVGSPIYMSPEGIKHNVYGPTTDVWAFGIFMFQLLHGKTPYSHCIKEKQLKYNISNPLNWNSLKSNLSYSIKEVILKCLQVNYQKRITFQKLKEYEFFKDEKTKSNKTLNNETNSFVKEVVPSKQQVRNNLSVSDQKEEDQSRQLLTDQKKKLQTVEKIPQIETNNKCVINNIETTEVKLHLQEFKQNLDKRHNAYNLMKEQQVSKEKRINRFDQKTSKSRQTPRTRVSLEKYYNLNNLNNALSKNGKVVQQHLKSEKIRLNIQPFKSICPQKTNLMLLNDSLREKKRNKVLKTEADEQKLNGLNYNYLEKAKLDKQRLKTYEFSFYNDNNSPRFVPSQRLTNFIIDRQPTDKALPNDFPKTLRSDGFGTLLYSDRIMIKQSKSPYPYTEKLMVETLKSQSKRQVVYSNKNTENMTFRSLDGLDFQQMKSYHKKEQKYVKPYDQLQPQILKYFSNNQSYKGNNHKNTQIESDKPKKKFGVTQKQQSESIINFPIQNVDCIMYLIHFARLISKLSSQLQYKSHLRQIRSGIMKLATQIMSFMNKKLKNLRLTPNTYQNHTNLSIFELKKTIQNYLYQYSAQSREFLGYSSTSIEKINQKLESELNTILSQQLKHSQSSNLIKILYLGAIYLFHYRQIYSKYFSRSTSKYWFQFNLKELIKEIEKDIQSAHKIITLQNYLKIKSKFNNRNL